MKEAKVIDTVELPGPESLEGVFWQWQSGPNPDFLSRRGACQKDLP